MDLKVSVTSEYKKISLEDKHKIRSINNDRSKIAYDRSNERQPRLF